MNPILVFKSRVLESQNAHIAIVGDYHMQEALSVTADFVSIKDGKNIVVHSFTEVVKTEKQRDAQNKKVPTAESESESKKFLLIGTRPPVGGLVPIRDQVDRQGVNSRDSAS